MPPPGRCHRLEIWHDNVDASRQLRSTSSHRATLGISILHRTTRSSNAEDPHIEKVQSRRAAVVLDMPSARTAYYSDILHQKSWPQPDVVVGMDKSYCPRSV